MNIPEILKDIETLLPTLLPLIIALSGLLLVIICFLLIWLRQKPVQSTIDYLQQNNIPYTLRSTPLSYDIKPQPPNLKESKVVEIEKKQE